MASSTADVDDAETRLLSGYSGRMVTLAALGWMTVLLGRQVIPPLLPTIIDDLSITSARAGFALTLMMGVYALLQYPAGRLSDALSRKTLMVPALGGTVIGFVLLGTVTTYPQLLVATLLIGACPAFYFTPSRAFLSDLFVERRGQAFGVQATAGLGGSALAAGIAVVALNVATWQAAFLPAIVLLVLVGASFHRWSHESYVFTLEDVDLDVVATFERLLRSSRIRRLLVVRIAFGFTFQSVISFLPTLLHADKGFSTALASGSFALLYVVGSVSAPAAGRLSDRFDRSRVVLASLAGALLGLVVLVVGVRPSIIVGGIVVMAAGLSALFPVLQAYFMDAFPDASMGGDFGAAKTVYTGIASVGPTYVGVVATRQSYVVAFAGLTVVILAAIALVVTFDDGGT
ncbi:MAG: MFS transporter [Haloarculaceae archaeon]